MFEKLRNLASMVKQAGQLKGKMADMQAAMAEVQEKLQRTRVVGEACGGAIRVEMSGLIQVVDCQISPALAAGGDADAISRYVILAVNQAIEKARQVGSEAMGKATEGLDLPGMDGLPGAGQ